MNKNISPLFRSIPPSRNSARGASLLELIIQLLFASVLLIATTHIVRASFQVRLKFGHSQRAADNFLLARSHVSELFQAVDSARFTTSFSVHQKGLIRFSDMTLHPIMQSTEHSPHPRSDALSSLALELDSTWEISRCSEMEDYSRALLCAQNSASLEENTRDFALLTLNGMLFTRASLVGNGKCREAVLTKKRNLTSSFQSREKICFARLAIPIRRYRTLFVDKRGTLRLLYHEGEETSSNQPLIEKFGTLRLFPATRTATPELRILTTSLHGDVFGGMLRSRLERVSHLNFLLNL